MASEFSTDADGGTVAMARGSSATGGRRPARRVGGREPAGGESLFDTEPDGVSRLHTVAMMADILRVPPAAIRHWVRSGLLEPVRSSGGIAWFDFPQLVAGRQLARLLTAGLSLREIDAGVRSLAREGVAAAVRDGAGLMADGRRICIRRDDLLLGPGGQMQLTFHADELRCDPGTAEPPVATVPIAAVARTPHARRPASPPSTKPSARAAPPLPEWLDEGAAEACPGGGPAVRDRAAGAELVALAADLEAEGAIEEAAEALRAALQAEGPSAPLAFMLAELLYRSGDLTAARERYYAAVELDGDHLEARASLGCVLAELGEHELAIAALEGVLRQQPDYADAHWHLAGVLAGVGRAAESRQHLRAFLRIAPESPWAAAARDRLAAHDRG